MCSGASNDNNDSLLKQLYLNTSLLLKTSEITGLNLKKIEQILSTIAMKNQLSLLV
jgi:hypothetical protein